jgi:3-hydroxybutyryl-CoA dehydrogenase
VSVLEIKRISVIGAGQMGSGIAQVAIQAGFAVILMDITTTLVERGLQNLEHNLARQVDKGKLKAQEQAVILSQLSTTTKLEVASDVDLVIEAIKENKEDKGELFKRLDEMAAAHTIFASNTSSLSITELAANTKRPEQVIGMHFMNPVPVMKLIEVIRGLATNEETYQTIVEVSKRLGKLPVEVNDFPGFISNRVLMPMINESIYAIYEGVATPEAIDEVMKLGMNHPMGPLELADFIGLDTCLYIMETLYEGFGDSKYRPCPLLKKYVVAGWLGKKSGRGFYQYRS